MKILHLNAPVVSFINRSKALILMLFIFVWLSSSSLLGILIFYVYLCTSFSCLCSKFWDCYHLVRERENWLPCFLVIFYQFYIVLVGIIKFIDKGYTFSMFCTLKNLKPLYATRMNIYKVNTCNRAPK